MNAVMVQLASAIGFFLGVITFVVCVVKGSPFLGALFRASLTMVLGSLIIVCFFRFFTKVLYDFIAEKQKEQQAIEEAAGKTEAESRRERRKETRTQRSE